MFTDLVGSTALSTKLDPEDLRSVIGAYHSSFGNGSASNGNAGLTVRQECGERGRL
jgi:class 3 adenylate cyclase